MIDRSGMSHVKKCLPSVVAFVLICVCLGCSIKLIAPYDEAIDKQATQLQGQIDQFITDLIYEGGNARDEAARRSALAYGTFQKDYARIGVALRSLKIRTEAVSLSSNTANQVKYIIDNLEMLEARHKGYTNETVVDGEKTTMGTAYLRNARDIINEQFRALLALEAHPVLGCCHETGEFDE